MRTLMYNDPNTVLTGQVYTDYFYGRSGYGETPEIDELEHAIFLALDETISIPSRAPEFEGNYDSTGCRDVDHVQLAGRMNVQHLRDTRGHGVEVAGGLFHAHTGHHHSEVLISLGDSEVRIIDDRDTFAGAQVVGSGTGFLLGHDGLIATAAHVVSGALGITVTRGLFRSKARLERFDPDSDLAILRFEPKGAMMNILSKREHRVRPIRTWMPPQLGERIYTFGFPLRPVLPHSLNMSEGIISAEVGIRSERFQISAPIQKGNSGGPVYDRHGNLIGVITSKLRPAQQFVPENVNFAIRAACLLDLCGGFRDSLNMQEQRSQVSPIVLAKTMQESCVEVERWEKL